MIHIEPNYINERIVIIITFLTERFALRPFKIWPMKKFNVIIFLKNVYLRQNFFYLTIRQEYVNYLYNGDEVRHNRPVLP